MQSIKASLGIKTVQRSLKGSSCYGDTSLRKKDVLKYKETTALAFFCRWQANSQLNKVKTKSEQLLVQITY